MGAEAAVDDALEQLRAQLRAREERDAMGAQRELAIELKLAHARIEAERSRPS